MIIENTSDKIVNRMIANEIITDSIAINLII